mmetsp:Transcript_62542/g.123077  ORF Transcript_62542/g.123077 Transcript_62542/m.123077 type:complete len:310 (-) Transcript_62542:424-1353(-)
MSAMEKMSSVDTSSSSSSPFCFASSLLASFAFCAGEALNSSCFFCHSAKSFFHWAWRSWNHFEGCRVSTLDVFFFSSTLERKYSVALASLSHSNFTSSKPSSFFGRDQFAKLLAMTASLQSATGFGANQVLFSSSVNSTFGGSVSSSSSGSIGSSFFSSSASLPSSTSIFSSSFFSSSFSSSALPSSFPSPSCFAASSFFFFSASSCFCLRSASFFFRSASIFFFISSARFLASACCFARFFSACLTRHALSEDSCFFFKSFSCCDALNSSSGSPMTTTAVRLKYGAQKRRSAFFRSASRRLLRTSMTT